MKLSRMLLARVFGFCLLAGLVIFGASCETTAGPGGPEDPIVNGDILRVGAKLRIELSGTPTPVFPLETTIKSDGTITLPLINDIRAAGLDARQLEQVIQTNYVPRFYTRLTVTVNTPDQFFYVGGQVKMPNRQLYFSGVTVLRAIQSAGDFTDFANRKKVQLVRASGKKHVINCIKALENPKLDLPVYPGDSINVPNKLL
jgi:protein involved in polysaccharide export with SLBB domain